MAIPRFNELLSPLLNVLSDGTERSRSEARSEVLGALSLSDDELNETIKSGGGRASNRVSWALIYLAHAGAIKIPRRGRVVITELGQQLLKDYPSGITLNVLKSTPGFQEWDRQVKERKAHERKNSSDSDDTAENEGVTPDELIEASIARLRSSMALEILDRVRNESPQFLEEVVLKVLHAMGYGEGEDDLEHLGGSGDGGVDGVINQDKLGLDQIYVQAKRYREDCSIGRPDIQAFVGAISGKSATRGVFITTSRFTQDARDFALHLSQPRIILVDGNQLADLMMEHEIGVAVDKVYKVFKIDENFFED